MYVYVLCALLLVLAVIYAGRRRGRGGLNLPPGPWNLPVVGYLPFIDPQRPYLTLTRLAGRFGPVYGLWMGNVYTVVVSDAKIIRSLFAKQATTGRAPLYVTHGIMNGHGIICAEGDLWHDQRKFVAKSLRTIGVTKHDNPSRERLQHDILAEVNDFVQFLGKSGGPLDPLVALRHNVGAVVCKLVFGKSWPRDDALWQWLQHTQEEGLKHIGVAGPLNFLPFLRFIPLFSRTMKFLLNGKQVSHSVYKKIISDRCATDIDESALRNFLEAFVVERKKIASDAIASSFYSDVQFHHLLADLFGAGLDTTLVTLRWYLLYMAKNITIQQQVQSEIDNHCTARQLVLADQADLPFTVASIMEAQRIRSVTPLGIPHGSLEPVVGIEGTRYEIPAGAMIVPLQWAVHMDPHQWPNPEQFDPTRFLDPDNQSTIRDYFIPFQTGKRMCVGDELARMILFLFAAGTVQRFTISIAEPAEVDMDGECGITLSPLPCMLNFEERDGL